MNRRAAVWFVAFGVALACKDQGPTPSGPASAFLKVRGDKQVAFPGIQLTTALTVQVTDSTGQGLPGVTINWTSNRGNLSANSTMTGADGMSGVTHTLDVIAGVDTIVARAVGRTDSLVFVEYAVRIASAVAEVAVPANYGLHDTFVRDGIAFACVWNTGIIVFDVGDGRAGGSPRNPVPLDTILTNVAPLSGRAVHNAWWFHNPALNQKRYLFAGQEGPGSIGSTSSGDIHVIDVSDLSNGSEVAFYHMNGAGTHNFWVDEATQVLYAAYYNGGVVAIDVSDTLVGDLASREIARIQPGGAGNTYVWSVQLGGSSLYAVDMLSGVWQLNRNGSTFSVAGGGNNVPERFSSDFWVHGNHIYSGSWGTRSGNAGNAVKIWRLNAGGAPVLVDSIITPDIGTVSDIQVSQDGQVLVFSAEGGPLHGLHIFDLTDPEKPVPLARSGPMSLHTATIAEINGSRYVFAAKNPNSPAMVVFDITALAP